MQNLSLDLVKKSKELNFTCQYIQSEIKWLKLQQQYDSAKFRNTLHLPSEQEIGLLPKKLL